jgi:hypothetical protein
MKKATWIITFLFLFLLLLLTGCGRVKEPVTVTPEPLPKQDIASDEFDSANQCQYCHLEIYEQWRGTTHALSAKNPAFLGELKRTSSETNGASDAFCVSCHIPVGWLAGEIPPVDGSNLSDVAKLGVSCDFCHAISSVTGTGNAGFRVTPGNVKLGPFDDPIHTPLHESEYSEVHTQAEICAACHEIIHPQNGLVLASTYSEWKESSFGSRRITCQDCHMTPGSGVTKPNPGVAATGAPKKREHTWTHNMVGNNVFAMEQAGFNEHAAMAEENLQAAAALFLGLPDRLSPYQPAKINIRIRNDGAGHYLPTGLSLFKDMWLEVICTNESGNVVHSSGVLNNAGAIPEGTVVFKTRFADAAGQETDNLWEAVKILDDHRIPPKEYVDEFVEIPGLPLPGTLNVQVRLLYRNITPARATQLGLSASDIPVIEMAKINGTVSVR